jgi:putative SOS response-associated peptidase YedK
MCGRFTLRTPPGRLVEEFGLASEPDFAPRYNIAPTQPVAAVRLKGGQRELAMLNWGLVPFWAKDARIGNRNINARSETAAQKPMFREAFRSRRCLIPADGFYEWRKIGPKRKQPYFIHAANGRPFAFAGLWERWNAGGEPLESCTILTTDANGLLAPLHDRMPVILPPDKYEVWLDPDVQQKALQPLLTPLPVDALTLHAVSTEVNRPANDSPRCIEPVSAQTSLLGM